MLKWGIYYTRILPEIIDFIHAKNGHIVIVPPSFTDELQEMDVGVNSVFKQLLSKQCGEHRANHSINKLGPSGETLPPQDVFMDYSLSYLKPLHMNWTSISWHIIEKERHIARAFKEVDEALKGYTVDIETMIENTFKNHNADVPEIPELIESQKKLGKMAMLSEDDPLFRSSDLLYVKNIGRIENWKLPDIDEEDKKGKNVENANERRTYRLVDNHKKRKQKKQIPMLLGAPLELEESSDSEDEHVRRLRLAIQSRDEQRAVLHEEDRKKAAKKKKKRKAAKTKKVMAESKRRKQKSAESKKRKQKAAESKKKVKKVKQTKNRRPSMKTNRRLTFEQEAEQEQEVEHEQEAVQESESEDDEPILINPGKKTKLTVIEDPSSSESDEPLFVFPSQIRGS